MSQKEEKPETNTKKTSSQEEGATSKKDNNPDVDEWALLGKQVRDHLSRESWNAERHRTKPSFVIGVAIKLVVPHIVKLLK